VNPDPAGTRPAGTTVVRSPSWLRLANGMIVRAAIEARLLGRKLLTLDADIAILPAERETRPVPKAHLNGSSPGRGLARAARALDSGASDLEEARRRVSG